MDREPVDNECPDPNNPAPDTVQGPSWLQRFAGTLYPPLYELDQPRSPEPGQNADGEPISGEYGVGAATFDQGPDARPVDAPHYVHGTVVPDQVVTVKGAERWRAQTVGLTAGEAPKLAVGYRPDRLSIRLRHRGETGVKIRVAGMAGSALDDTTCALLTVGVAGFADNAILDLTTTGEIWVAASGTCTLEIIEELYR